MTDNIKKKNHRMALYMPEELEIKARKKAFDMGLIKDGEGMINSYISILITEDLKLRLAFPTHDVYEVYGEGRIRANLSIPKEIRIDDVRERAAELGFEKNGKGNIGGYINFLLHKHSN